MKAKFEPGQLVVTPNALTRIHPADVPIALGRHLSGDWGDCCAEDWAENELSLREGFRLFSVHKDRRGVRFWIITEANRSQTTVLVPEDY